VWGVCVMCVCGVCVWGVCVWCVCVVCVCGVCVCGVCVWCVCVVCVCGVCVFTVLLPPGVNPIAVNKYIKFYFDHRLYQRTQNVFFARRPLLGSKYNHGSSYH